MNRRPKQQKPAVVRGNRRLAPATLQPRARSADDDKPAELESRADAGAPDAAPGGAPGAPGSAPGAGTRSHRPPEGEVRPRTETEEAAALRAQLQERTADLQRVKAEYDNYRRRVRRDRLTVGEIAVANVLAGLLPVLDAIDRAREHGEVTGGFRRVAEVLEGRLTALGLESFGRPGDSFDPVVHDALSHTCATQVDRPVCATVHRPGYRVGGHLLRPAQVDVSEPPAGPPDEWVERGDRGGGSFHR